MNPNPSTLLSRAHPQWFYEEVPTPSGYRVPYFFTVLNAFWPDLEENRGAHFKTEAGYANAMAFWENPLRNAAPDIDWPPSGVFPPVLFEPSDEVEQDTPLPLTKGMVGAWNVRPDMHHFDLNTRLGRLQMVHWRLTLGGGEYRFLAITEEEVAFLQAPSTAHGGRIAHLPRLAELVPVLVANQPELVTRLFAGDASAYEYCWAPLKAPLEEVLANAVRRADAYEAQPSRSIGTLEEGSINIVGFATGQFGIGEDARTATRAMLQAGIKPVVYEPPIPLACAVIKDGWINEHIQPAPVHRFNLLTMPAPDTLRLFFLQQRGVLQGRYNICGWQWELPHWPRHWHPLMNIPDEIWAQSRYVQHMFQEVTNKPVTYMPLAVEMPSFTQRSRESFDLPDGPYTFLSVFDCNSWYQRKNPMGAIYAFQAAFAPSSRDVQLVIKMMNARHEMQEYKELMRLAAQDPRVHVIDEFLSRSDMLALLDAVDVFVSLHRSEGFGRVAAESMILGKPVISTNYSGSVDFAHEGTAYVVDGPLIDLRKGDYSEWEGQHWMDPDIGMAAEAMRRCVEDRAGTQAMAERGRQIIIDNHSIEAVSRRYAQRLRELGAIA